MSNPRGSGLQSSRSILERELYPGGIHIREHAVRKQPENARRMRLELLQHEVWSQSLGEAGGETFAKWL